VTCPAGRLLRPDATTAGWSKSGVTAPEDKSYFVDTRVSDVRFAALASRLLGYAAASRLLGHTVCHAAQLSSESVRVR
jgi:hypothetical protein